MSSRAPSSTWTTWASVSLAHWTPHRDLLPVILRAPPSAHKATRHTWCPSFAFLAGGAGLGGGAHTYLGQESRACLLQQQSRQAGDQEEPEGTREESERPGRFAPAHQPPDGTPRGAAQCGWQYGSQPGRPGARSTSLFLHLIDQGHTGTEMWDCHRPTRALRAPQTRGRCPAAPNILDRSLQARAARWI